MIWKRHFTFLKTGPKIIEQMRYSLNSKKNEQTDAYRKELAFEQTRSANSIERKREGIESNAEQYGGKVQWGKEKQEVEKLVLPMTKPEYDTLLKRAAKVGKKLDVLSQLRTGKKETDYENKLGDSVVRGTTFVFKGYDLDCVDGSIGRDLDYLEQKNEEEPYKRFRLYSTKFRTPNQANMYINQLDRMADTMLKRLGKIEDFKKSRKKE